MNNQNLVNETAWAATLGELKLQAPRATFNSWLNGSTFAGIDNGYWLIMVKSAHAQTMLGQRKPAAIANILRAMSRQEVMGVDFIVESKEEDLPAANGRRMLPPVNGKGTPAPEPEWPPEPETPSPAQPKTLTSGQAMISIMQNDPARRGWVAVPHYAIRFWRPFLGGVPYALWQVLRSYGWDAQFSGNWPTVSLLAATLGQGTRATILGRNASGRRPAQRGAIQVLADHGLAGLETKGQDRQTVYFFSVLDEAPVLVPAQVDTLPKPVQRAHEQFLQRVPGFNYAAWQAITETSLVQPVALMRKT